MLEAYVRHGPLPTLQPGDIAVLDNLSSRRRVAARALMEAAGARLRVHSPHSPEFDPITMAFSKLNALVRKVAVPTAEGLWTAIGRLIDLITPEESANFLTAAGYEPDCSGNALASAGIEDAAVVGSAVR